MCNRHIEADHIFSTPTFGSAAPTLQTGKTNELKIRIHRGDMNYVLRLPPVKAIGGNVTAEKALDDFPSIAILKQM